MRGGGGQGQRQGSRVGGGEDAGGCGRPGKRAVGCSRGRGGFQGVVGDQVRWRWGAQGVG